MVYLFSQGITSCALGIMLTFATPGLYPAYVTPTDPYGMLAHLRYDLGLTPALDQQLGGVFMWVPGCLVYIGAVLAILGRWLSAPDIDDIVPASEAAATRKAAAPALKEEM